jgi:hypothetical protein
MEVLINKRMNDLDYNKKLISLMEGAFVMPGQAEENENVTYSKTKTQGDATVTVSANAKSMEELHDVLKLAGITLPNSDHNHEEPEAEEPEAEEPEVEVSGDEDCDSCANDDPSYSTDKAVLTSVIKDRLLSYLKNSQNS